MGTHFSTVHSVRISESEEYIASGGKDGIVKLWNFKYSFKNKVIEVGHSKINSIYLSHKDRFVVSGSENR